MSNTIDIYGAGLAGAEAAWQAAKYGAHVRLYEMKPEKRTPAHTYGGFAELVCSNSLRSDCLTNAVGLLKEEMHRLGSLVMEAAYECRVPAGGALAVDRFKFSDYITEKLRSNPNIEIIAEEKTDGISENPLIIATGPLTSDPLASWISGEFGASTLNFFDAAAPIVDFSTVDMEKAFFASRYGKGDADYINCPMEKDEYLAFLHELLNARTAELHEFDSDAQKAPNVFEGCMPVEVMAARGEDTLRYGPLKPVGLPDPKTGKEFYAVVQLRKEDRNGTMYNLVGFQTHLAIPEQKRVFRMIPGLENAEFFRFGVMHRNTYLNSPGLLDGHYRVIGERPLWFAGQMTGVEGYIESAASGMLAGIDAAFSVRGEKCPEFSDKTAIGALGCYVSRGSNGRFDPMNVNFGIIAPLDKRVKGGKKAKNEALAARALEIVDGIAAELSAREQGK
ncbi:MAG: methylenetetrahydrofolate--tRNA-(uracil(54)-C(5))-methyltransferase (FADH(2)-oxidizing) TrmFO [Clostridia bacterium]|nr:methylenetetrahydrofolate--tRNA-(uracil(54)-C(5))-methyltransferase (FADH(2)-oxidizing) TrmFO [Clostridia bacterium]MBQ5649119.1 methylenetetrahydrofolate--tRNA-(uracil(54)-C(5))-methyltransferase (FADH(2)-oxidizing) TrmFO [Clostridia bacterium]